MKEIKFLKDTTLSANLNKPMRNGNIKRYNTGETVKIHESWMDFLNPFSDRFEIIDGKKEVKDDNGRRPTGKDKNTPGNK